MYKYSNKFGYEDEKAIRQVMSRLGITDRSKFTELAIVTFCNQYMNYLEESLNGEVNGENAPTDSEQTEIAEG